MEANIADFIASSSSSVGVELVFVGSSLDLSAIHFKGTENRGPPEAPHRYFFIQRVSYHSCQLSV